MKKVMFSSIIALFSLLFLQTARAQDSGKGHKVVFQFVSADTLSQKSLVNNLRNLKAAWPDADVEVVFHGAGISMVMSEKTRYANILQDYVEKKQIKMVVCENTMRERKVTKAELLPFVGTVPSAMLELISKQEQGWAYLKAGL